MIWVILTIWLLKISFPSSVTIRRKSMKRPSFFLLLLNKLYINKSRWLNSTEWYTSVYYLYSMYWLIIVQSIFVFNTFHMNKSIEYVHFTNKFQQFVISLRSSFSTTSFVSSNFMIQRSMQLFTATWLSVCMLCARHFWMQLSVILFCYQDVDSNYRL